MPITTTEQEQPVPIPDWVYLDENQTRDLLEELAPVCDCCSERRIVRSAASPDFVVPDDDRVQQPLEDYSWFRLNGVRNSRTAYRDGDIMVRADWLYYDSYCSNACFNIGFDALDEHYDYLCESCYNDRSEADNDASSYDDDEPSSRYVQSYSYRPRTMFYEFDENTGVFRAGHSTILSKEGALGVHSPASIHGMQLVQRPFCGFELEMSDEAGRLRFSEAAEYLNTYTSEYAYMKQDGSVGNGFELVTHPHSLLAYQNRTAMWSAIDHLRNKGWRSWSSSSSCGLHIHINNASFVDVGHAMRFLKFIYDNKSPLVAFAGRDSSYARFNFDEFVQREVHTGWNDDGSSRFEMQNLSHVVKKSQTNQGRYLAVNAQNEHTYELRFFRGSMRPATVLACLEFTFALHEYTQGLNSHDCLVKRALGWRSFLAFIRNKSGEENFPYRNLLTRLTQARRNPDTGFLGLSDES